MTPEVFAIIKILVLTTLSFIVAMAWTPVFAYVVYRLRLGKQIRD